MSNDNQYAIETLSLTKIFPDWWGRAKVIAVEDLDLKIKQNEVYGLLGPNGSGKTTTLKMMLSLLHPTRGKALILGGSSSDTAISERIGYLPEESYLYKYLSARETLEFYGRIFGIPRAVRKARIESLLEMVGLSGMANRPIGTFSKGMARRIGLAQALINDPEVLILDEPTSGMDPIGTRQMKDLIIQLAKRGKTILLCSHLLADVEDVCDRIGILYGGKMRVEGTVASLLRNKEELQITTDKISDEALDKIKKILEQEKLKCEITSPMDRLEDFFVRTVAEAQKQKASTSGAVNTGQIGQFLSEQEKQENILDELVSAPSTDDSKEQIDVAQAETDSVKSIEPETTPIKNELLDDLIKPTGTLETDISMDSKPVETDDQQQAKVRQNLLNDLMGQGNADTERTEQTEDE